MAITMKSAVERILAAHQCINDFKSESFYSVKVENPGFMPLCIERQGSRVLVTHYFEQGGDLIADPDMEFQMLSEEADWIPIAIQQCTGHYSQAATFEGGQWKINPAVMRDLQQFSKMWARNLLAQGFEAGTLVRAEAG